MSENKIWWPFSYERQFPSLKAEVLQDGHIDHITGPRCVVQMKEGPNFGKYQIVTTEKVLSAGDAVSVSGLTKVHAAPLTA